MNNFDFAIERVFRFFQNEYTSFECYVVQITIPKEQIKNDYYSFEMIDSVKSEVLYNISLLFNPLEKKVTEKDSHEDPLIETEDSYLVCLQIPHNLIIKLDNDILIRFKDKNQNVLAEKLIKNLSYIFSLVNLNKTYSHIVEDYYLISEKDCILRIHMGSRHGEYKEEEINLKNNVKFYFKDYLYHNSYIGLQCSYENEATELEEKYIVIGQKGIINSHDILAGEYIYEPLLPFVSKYKVLMTNMNIDKNDQKDYIDIIKSGTKEVMSISDLLEYLNNKEMIFFETNIEFIKKQYKSKRTYGFGNTYNTEMNKMSHIDSQLCTHCEYNSKCLQVVPSGLSYKLFKQNISLECPQECKVFKFINKKLITDKYDI